MRYPQPDNEDDFEQICLRYYRKKLQNEGLVRYGKRGEKQNGIDIFDTFGKSPVYAIQCKHHEDSKTIPPSEIIKEVTAAEQSFYRIDYYIIATTAKKSGRYQNCIRELNERENSKFTVQIEFWDDICRDAHTMGAIVASTIIYGRDIYSEKLKEESASKVPSLRMPVDTEILEDERYSMIDRLISRRELTIARYELEKLKSSTDLGGLPHDERFIILRLQGKLALEDENYEVASEFFLQAFDASPELERAKQNQVFAYYLLGENNKAHKLSEKYLAEGIKTTGMIQHFINTAKSIDEIEKQNELIDSFIESDESINIALCHKYHELKDDLKSAEAASRALEISPNSPHSLYALATTKHNTFVNQRTLGKPKAYAQAIQYYNRAETNAKNEKYNGLLVEILINRGTLKALKGCKSEAKLDFMAAIKMKNNAAKYVEHTLKYYLHDLDFDSANELREFLDTSTLNGKFLSLIIDCHQISDSEGKRDYIYKMKLLAGEQWEKSIECVFYAVQWAIDIEDNQLAEDCISVEFHEKYPFQSHVIRALIYLSFKEESKAKEVALNALDVDSSDAHPQQIRSLANILKELQETEHALNLFELVYIPGVFNDDTKALWNCANKLYRDDILLRLGKELRETKSSDDKIRRTEVKLLMRYDPDLALKLSKQYIEESETPKYFNALKNNIAIQLEKTDEIDLDPSQLPSPNELEPIEADFVLLPYVFYHKYDEALKFLYAQLRSNFEDKHAHMKYIYFYLTYNAKFTINEMDEKAGENSAVQIHPSKGSSRWVIIENDSPVSSRDEFSSENKLSKSLLEKKIGDVIGLPGNSIQTENAVLLNIQSKYLRMFQNCQHNYRRRFPESTVLQQFDLEKDGEFDPSIIVKSLEQRREYVSKCKQFYNEQLCSIFLLAERLNFTELEVMEHLLRDPVGAIRSCELKPQKYDYLKDYNQDFKTAVLTVSSIVTFSLLDVWKHLDSNKRYLIPRSIKNLIKEWIHDAEVNSIYGDGYVALDENNRLYHEEPTEKDRETHIRKLNTLLEHINQYCDETSAPSMADLHPEKRSLYQKAIGLHNTEALCIAQQNDAVVFSDDFVVGFVAKADFGIQYCWTQLLMDILLEQNKINVDDFNLATAKLAAWNYTITQWNAETIIQSGEHVGWDTNKWPFNRCLSLIATSPMPNPTRLHIVTEFLKKLRASSCSELNQTAIIQSTLNYLNNPQAVRIILKKIDSIFWIDYISADFIRAELRYWLQTH